MKLLIKDLNELKSHLTFEAGFLFETILPYIQEAQETFVVKMLGRTFYTNLINRWDPEAGDITDQEKMLIHHLQGMVAHHAAVLAMPYFIVSLTNGGLTQKETTNRKGIFQWQDFRFENAHLEAAYTSKENALLYLWEFRNHERFVAWKNSDQEGSSVSMLVNSALDFHAHYPINSSRRTFEAIKNFIKDSHSSVKQIIGADLYDDILNDIRLFDFSEENESLLPYLRAVVCHKAIMRCGSLPLKITADGIMITSMPGSTGTIRNQNQADADRIIEMKNEAAISYEEKVSDLRDYLLKHIDEYPLYANSKEYKSLIATPTDTNDNSSTIIL